MKKHIVFPALTGSLFVMAMLLISQTKKPATTAKPAASKSASGGMAASMTRGKQVYLEQCLACHQADALGVSGMNPPLVKTKFVLGDKSKLVKIVLNGMTGIEVEGEDYHGVMAPHSDLTDQQIADVLTYVRNSFGNKAKAVTAAEVKAIRATNTPAK
ncbi:MAG TPA: cytochrome c [Puia sp.]|jgi:mono/diheme cytochrome c family protein